jgi:hypothetical protein
MLLIGLIAVSIGIGFRSSVGAGFIIFGVGLFAWGVIKKILN